MAPIRGADIIHLGNGTFLLDRIQSGGPGSLNPNRERIFELGNYRSIGQLSDIPDVQYAIESFDVTNEIEDMLTGGAQDFSLGVDLALTLPTDVAAQFKP
jgi:hypothetical protein